MITSPPLLYKGEELPHVTLTPPSTSLTTSSFLASTMICPSSSVPDKTYVPSPVIVTVFPFIRICSIPLSVSDELSFDTEASAASPFSSIVILSFSRRKNTVSSSSHVSSSFSSLYLPLVSVTLFTDACPSVFVVSAASAFGTSSVLPHPAVVHTNNKLIQTTRLFLSFICLPSPYNSSCMAALRPQMTVRLPFLHLIASNISFSLRRSLSTI